MNRSWIGLDDARTLVPLPVATARLAALPLEEEVDVGAIEALLRPDRVSTRRVIACADALFTARRRGGTSLDQAIRHLGPATVLAIAIGSAERELFCGALPLYGLARDALWRHSVATAVALEAARDFCRVPVPPEAFAVGLLHDLGKPVLTRSLDAETLEVVRSACSERGIPESEVEEQMLGLHGELGARVTEAWGLPPRITSAIRHHHAPLYAENVEGRRLAQGIALGDAVACTIGAPGGRSLELKGLDVASADRLGISGRGFDELCDRVAQQLDVVLAALG